MLFRGEDITSRDQGNSSSPVPENAAARRLHPDQATCTGSGAEGAGRQSSQDGYTTGANPEAADANQWWSRGKSRRAEEERGSQAPRQRGRQVSRRGRAARGTASHTAASHTTAVTAVPSEHFGIARLCAPRYSCFVITVVPGVFCHSCFHAVIAVTDASHLYSFQESCFLTAASSNPKRARVLHPQAKGPFEQTHACSLPVMLPSLRIILQEDVTAAGEPCSVHLLLACVLLLHARLYVCLLLPQQQLTMPAPACHSLCRREAADPVASAQQADVSQHMHTDDEALSVAPSTTPASLRSPTGTMQQAGVSHAAPDTASTEVWGELEVCISPADSPAATVLSNFQQPPPTRLFDTLPEPQPDAVQTPWATSGTEAGQSRLGQAFAAVQGSGVVGVAEAESTPAHEVGNTRWQASWGATPIDLVTPSTGIASSVATPTFSETSELVDLTKS